MTDTRHFLSVNDLSTEQLQDTLALTAKLKQRPDRFRTVLQHCNIGMLFMKPSTRTRISFEVGINQLGGHAVVLSSSELQLGRGETVADTANVLSRYLDGVMARVFEHSMLETMAREGSIPIINGLSDRSHPCQALCDYFTLQQARGPSLKGLKMTYLGDGNNVAHSLLIGAALLGVHLTIACPKGYEPDADIVAQARSLATASGAELKITEDPMAAAADVDAIYTDVWASMGQEDEQKARAIVFEPFRVTTDIMMAADKDAVFMHCLPAHRGDEVSADVIDGRWSIVFDQAENRLHSQKALFCQIYGV